MQSVIAFNISREKLKSDRQLSQQIEKAIKLDKQLLVIPEEPVKKATSEQLGNLRRLY